ncbi:hypothetical protein AC781_10755 [Akkermansia glycaniphila]|nr:hypothetical protein AC781_10755 [Akkermansia glycaniphila]
MKIITFSLISCFLVSCGKEDNPYNKQLEENAKQIARLEREIHQERLKEEQRQRQAERQAAENEKNRIKAGEIATAKAFKETSARSAQTEEEIRNFKLDGLLAIVQGKEARDEIAHTWAYRFKNRISEERSKSYLTLHNKLYQEYEEQKITKEAYQEAMKNAMEESKRNLEDLEYQINK